MMGGLPDSPGVARQVVFSELERLEQMLPMEHGEKAVTFFSETGDLRVRSGSAEASVRARYDQGDSATHMMKSALALQVDEESGQQTGFELVREQPVRQS